MPPLLRVNFQISGLVDLAANQQSKVMKIIEVVSQPLIRLSHTYRFYI